MTLSPLRLSHLDHAVLSITGPDRETFLQGLTTNDVSRIGNDCAIYSTLLTPQGKFLFDFHIASLDERWLLETESARADELARRLGIFRLRVDVTIERLADWCVLALTGDGAAERLDLAGDAGATRPAFGGVAFIDPRLPALGVRLIVPRSAVTDIESHLGLSAQTDDAAYETARIALGVPRAGIDMPLEKATLLEANLQRLNGVSWSKGCYMGQELTARTYYRGLLKRRLFAVAVEGETPPPGTEITSDGSVVGELRSVAGDRAIAHLKIQAVESNDPLKAGSATIHVREPSWMAEETASAASAQEA